jgi:hypothetical protein
VSGPPPADAAPLRARLQPRVALHYPGFDRMREISDLLADGVRAYAFQGEDGREWYRRFAGQVFAAVEAHRFFPVYRMADGEFSFAMGALEDVLPLRRLRPRQIARRMLNLVTGRRGGHRSGSPGYGWEVYSPAERRALQQKYVADLTAVARHGYLALALDEGPFHARFLPYMLDWLDAQRIPPHAGNYQHPDAVFALLHGPDRGRLLRGRSILVVNHGAPARKDAITGGLRDAGAARVQWLGISRDKAMLERLDLSGVTEPVDLALVGAGVGAANVLTQLAPLSAPALDVGLVLDVPADPELRWDRPFCVPDGEMELHRIRFLPPAALPRLLRAERAGRDTVAHG